MFDSTGVQSVRVLRPFSMPSLSAFANKTPFADSHVTGLRLFTFFFSVDTFTRLPKGSRQNAMKAEES